MFDFIGDVHGEYKLLIKLLKKAGYQKDKDGILFHKKRTAFFLGDFIDKGDSVLKTFELVKAMTKKGYAKAILGNHELNFITINTQHNGEYLRPRSKKNLKQIKNSLSLTENYDENVKFLLSLPLFYENENVRAVHACWHTPSIEVLKDNTSGSVLTLPELKNLYSKKDEMYTALEICLKGLETSISPNEYLDYQGQPRQKARVNWWENGLLESVPEEYKKISHKEQFFYQDEKKVFFGHYAKKDKPYIQAPHALCLDFCSSKKLCLYRNDEKPLRAKRLISVSK